MFRFINSVQPSTHPVSRGVKEWKPGDQRPKTRGRRPKTNHPPFYGDHSLTALVKSCTTEDALRARINCSLRWSGLSFCLLSPAIASFRLKRLFSSHSLQPKVKSQPLIVCKQVSNPKFAVSHPMFISANCTVEMFTE